MSTTTTTLDIRVAATAAEARAALAEGYEPVECAFGAESVVGPLGLDHHGAPADEHHFSPGVGGRPEILGSRGIAMTREDAERAALLLAARIDEVSVPR